MSIADRIRKATTRKTAKTEAVVENVAAVDSQVQANNGHVHDFHETGAIDAGRPVERCRTCGEKRVQGDPK